MNHTMNEVAGEPSIRMDEDRLAWLAMALSPGLGPKRILDAMRELEAASQIFTLSLTALEGMRLPASAAQYIRRGRSPTSSKAGRT